MAFVRARFRKPVTKTRHFCRNFVFRTLCQSIHCRLIASPTSREIATAERGPSAVHRNFGLFKTEERCFGAGHHHLRVWGRCYHFKIIWGKPFTQERIESKAGFGEMLGMSFRLRSASGMYLIGLRYCREMRRTSTLPRPETWGSRMH